MGNDRLGLGSWPVLLVLLVVGTGCGRAADPVGHVLEYDLSLGLHADGSLAVTERVLVEFEPGHPASFPALVPAARIDTFSDLVVQVDGAPVGDLERAGHLRPGRTFLIPLTEAASGGTHRVEVSYQAQGVMAVRGARGVFVWPALSGGVATADFVTVRLSWPDGSVPMLGPAVDTGEWESAVTGTTAVFVGRDVPRSPAPLVYLDLVLADWSVAEPAWQVSELRARQLTPAFVSAGLFLVVVAAGILLMLRLQFSAGLVEVERLSVAHGLRVAALTVGIVSVLSAAMIPWLLGDLGVAPYAVPVGLAAAAILLGVRGLALPVRSAGKT